MPQLISNLSALKTRGLLLGRAALVVVAWGALVPAAWATMSVGEVRCEYAINPIAIDTLKPRLNWTLLDSERGQRQSAYQIRVAGSLKDLERENGLFWDSGTVLSDQNTGVVYEGKEPRSGARYYWKVRAWDRQGQPSPWSAPAFWQVALLDPADWKAKWIGLSKDAVPESRTTTDATPSGRPVLPKDCPRLRKVFFLEKPVRRATVCVCGLGFYELYVNGEKADDRVLAPANTDYSKRLLYDSVDVTAKVKPGANALGLWLAPGYSDDYSKYGWKWEHPKRAILQLDVVFEDGTTTSIISDESWRAGPSPLTFASVYDGEVYDARLETPGWATAQFAAQGWRPVRVLSATGARLEPNIMPPIRVTQTIRPVNLTEPKPGVFVFDLGQNFAGWVRLQATGPRGARIVLRHSELIGKDGMIDPWTNRRAKATDVFVLRGDGSESYEPRFTYHGFRYVEVTGYPGRPTRDDLTGCVVQADTQPAGTFTSSEAVLNQIDHNCVWSMRSNFKSIPTDCCQRDERTPCQMDSQAYEDAALCHFRMNRFYTKWLEDISGGRGNPDWNGDAVFLPWRLYWQYGDERALETHFSNMRAYVEFLQATTPDLIYTNGFGDWCHPNSGGWKTYFGDVTDVNTCLYAALVRVVSQTAAVLGKTHDATRYAHLAGEIVRAYNKQRFDPARAAYGSGSQTTALLPLALDLAPPARRAAVFAHLVATIRGKDKGHLDTGIFGTRYLVDVLSDFGEPDLAIRMLTRPDYPSFGNQIAQDATTVWEQWAFKGDMHSHNHAMFAGVSASFFTRLAGITPMQPGYAQIGIRPIMPRCLSFVEASQQTVKGRVAVRWQRQGDQIVMNVTVPVNTTARVAVPARGRQAVTESGKPAADADDVAFAGMEGDRAVFTVGSGNYRFVWDKPK
jgi:alpha-L-rhamnosidase